MFAHFNFSLFNLIHALALNSPIYTSSTWKIFVFLAASSNDSATCKEKNIPCKEADSRQKLGLAVGISVPASSVAVIDAGEAEAEIKGLK